MKKEHSNLASLTQTENGGRGVEGTKQVASECRHDTAGRRQLAVLPYRESRHRWQRHWKRLQRCFAAACDLWRGRQFYMQKRRENKAWELPRRGLELPRSGLPSPAIHPPPGAILQQS